MTIFEANLSTVRMKTLPNFTAMSGFEKRILNHPIMHCTRVDVLLQYGGRNNNEHLRMNCGKNTLKKNKQSKTK